MNQIRLMQILKTAVANICDLSNGYPASTEALWENYGELERAIQEEQKALATLADKAAAALVAGGFIFFKGPTANESPEDRQRQVANCIYRTLFES